MFQKMLSWFKANPALTGGIISALLALAGAFGLHLDAGQLAWFAALVTAASHGTVHILTNPAGQHEAGAREEHS